MKDHGGFKSMWCLNDSGASISASFIRYIDSYMLIPIAVNEYMPLKSTKWNSVPLFSLTYTKNTLTGSGTRTKKIQISEFIMLFNTS